MESLRIDPATEMWAVRVNLWVPANTLIAASAVIVVRARGTRGAEIESWVSGAVSEEVG